MSKVCYQCHTENPDVAIFCKKCGKTLDVTCPKCGNICENGSRFCDNCGTPLKTSSHSKRFVWIRIGCVATVAIMAVLFLIFKDRFLHTRDVIQCQDTIVNTSQIADYDGNTYKTVRIGGQLWMAENLRTTHYADGTSVPNGYVASETTAYWYYPDNNPNNKSKYGLLYNWKAVMHNSSSSSSNPSRVQGICPTGWHVPSAAEWEQFDNFVYSQQQYLCNNYGTAIAKALAANDSWTNSDIPCSVGNNLNDNNSAGFSALPAGFYTGLYYGVSTNADFWSATEHNESNAYGRYLYYKNQDFTKGNYNKDRGFSVRCVKD